MPWALALAACALAGTATAADLPDVTNIVSRMKASLEPERPSVRKMTFRVGGDDEQKSEIVAGEARKQVAGKARILLVILAPESLRGIGFLVQQGEGDRDVQWVYMPAIARVRKLVSPEAYTAFLNSDFTYADLGFVSMQARYRLLGEQQRRGVKAYEIEAVPKETWYYARTVTWVAADSLLPIEREYYDPANTLWKTERWDQVSVVDQVPVALRVSMDDVQAKSRTDIDVSAVRFDADIPDALLEPRALPHAVTSPVWNGLGG